MAGSFLTTATSRTRLWLACRWGCLGRRLSRARGNLDKRPLLWPCRQPLHNGAFGLAALEVDGEDEAKRFGEGDPFGEGRAEQVRDLSHAGIRCTR